MGSNFHAKILLVDEADASFVCVLWVRARVNRKPGNLLVDRRPDRKVGSCKGGIHLTVEDMLRSAYFGDHRVPAWSSSAHRLPDILDFLPMSAQHLEAAGIEHRTVASSLLVGFEHLELG